MWSRRSCDCIVFGYIIPCARNAYYHWSCEFFPRSWRDVLDKTLCDTVCQYLVTSRRFSPVFSTTKSNRHGLTEILLKVALNTLLQPKEMSQGQQFNQNIVEIWANHIPLAQIYTTAHILGVAVVLQYYAPKLS